MNISRRRVLGLAATALGAGAAGACSTAPRSGVWSPAASTPSGPAPGAGAGSDPADLAADMSDEDLVGQVLVPYAYGDHATEVTPGSAAGNQKIAGVDTPAEMISKYRLGAMILVGFSADDPTADTNPTSNLDSPAQIRALTDGLQHAAADLPAGVPLLVGTDQEYGVVVRVDSGIVQLPAAMAFGAAGDPDLTQAAWAAAARDLTALGLNVNFAPDSDVLGGPGGVIGSRSFGSDPDAVAKQVAAAVRGMHAAGLAATLKHFPGHGHTSADSHTGLPVLHQSRADLESGDLPPFKAGIAAGADLIMSGHLDVRAIDPGIPSSFSSKVLVDLLRGELGFTGIVITDALNMKPAERWSPDQAAVLALLAGNDLLLEPPDLRAARHGLLSALDSGQLPRARLIEAVTRILTLKLTLAGRKQPGLSTVDSSAGRAAAAKVAAAAVTVLRGPCGGPLVTGPVRVTTSGGRDRQRGWLSDALRDEGVRVVDSGGTRVHLVGYGDGDGDLAHDAGITVAMDTPYLLADAASPVLLATYSSSHVSMTALAATLAGQAGAPGRSPVAVSGLPRSTC